MKHVRALRIASLEGGPFMTTNHVHRTARICLLSAFLALALLSFFAFGSGRAHAQTVSSSTSTPVVSRININRQGFFAFSPSALTVTSGTVVKIVNKTIYGEYLFTNQGEVFLATGASMKIVATQSQSVSFRVVCKIITLTITVV
jgi:hypothetical protein